MALKSRKLIAFSLIADYSFLVASFFSVHFIKYGNLQLSPVHLQVFFIIILLWFAVNFLYKKHHILSIEDCSYARGISIITKSNIIIISLLSLAIVSFHLIEASRIQAYGSCFLFYDFEILGYTLYYLSTGKSKLEVELQSKVTVRQWSDTSFALTLVDAVLLLIAFMISTWLKRGSVLLSSDYLDILFFLYGLWLLSSFFTKKFSRSSFISFPSAIAPCFKSFLFMAAGLACIDFSLRFFHLSRLQIFGPLPILLGLEIVVFYLYYNYRTYGGNIKDIESIGRVKEIIRAEKPDLAHEQQPDILRDPVEEKLRNALEFLNPVLFFFIRDSIDLASIDRSKCALLHTDNLFNIQSLYETQHRLIVNLQKLNDIRWFNQYFLAAHNKLKINGYLIGMADTLDTHHDYFFRTLPKYLANILYIFDFTWRRILPKLPLAKKIYFALTKGRNRLVSRAEILGRLYFCGFRAVTGMEIDGNYYFIAQKIKEPSTDDNPTYGPLVHLKRYGAVNRPITVYKFRTMYPYSEYLQEYIYERNKLDKGGKFKDDFRLTAWGLFMRKLWLDELPMLYNWIRGDLQLVGVRPLSGQYLNLYSEELRELRKKVKPGLVPPFYADMPKTIEDIMESERRYIEAYLKAPFKTQWLYFIKCIFNIVFLKARSA